MVRNIRYSDEIKRYEFNTFSKSPWIMVGETTKIQGWKLHISTVPYDANRLLNIVLPELKKRKTCFKVIEDSNQLIKLNTGLLGNTQVGKFMTIYPDSDVEATKLANILSKLTIGFKGPSVETDMKISDVVYARYGAFKPIHITNCIGEIDNYIVDVNGELIADKYCIPFRLPKGVINIFNNHINEPVKKVNRLIGSRYLLIDTLRTHPKGGVGLALDIQNQRGSELKVIKQAKPYCMSDFYDRDGRNRLKYQEELHKKLYNMILVPRTEEYFEDNGFGYLPLEYIKGETLKTVIENEFHNNNGLNLQLNKKGTFLRYIIEICDFLIRLHELGYVHRDLTPTNIIITDNCNSVRIIDFELTHQIEDRSPYFQGYTNGFSSPEQIKGERPKFQDDIYSLGCIIIFILTGNSSTNLHKGLTYLYGEISRELIEQIRMCISKKSAVRPSLKKIKFQIEMELKDIEKNYK